MRIFVVFLFFLSFITEKSLSQESKIDSLKNLIALQDEDTSKVKLLISLGRELSTEQTAEPRLYFSQAIALAKKINYKKGAANAHLRLAFLHMAKYQFEESQKNIESAKSIYEEIKSPRGISRSIEALAVVQEAFYNNYDSALGLYEMSYQIYDSIDFKDGVAGTHYSKGYVHYLKGNNKLALEYFDKALEYYKLNREERQYWDLWSSIGMVYDGMGFYDDALKNYLKALEVAVPNETNKANLITLYNNVAIVYDNIENIEKSYEYYMKAFEIVKETGDKESEALLYNNLTYVKLDQGDTTLAIQYLWNSIGLYESLRIPCRLSYPFEGIGSIYLSQNKLDSALYYLKLGEKQGVDCQDQFVLSTLYKSLGTVYKKQKQYGSSLKYYTKSLGVCKEMGLRNELKEVYFELADFYEQQKKYDQALTYHKAYQSIKDSIYSSESADNIARMTAEYDFKKERMLIELENEKRALMMTAQLEREALNRNTILIVLFLSIILLGTLLRGYFIIRNRNKKLTSLNEEKNTLIGVVAHDLRSPLNNMKSLVPIIRNSSDTITKDQSHYLDLFDLSTTRMSDMINRVLDINAIEAQKVLLKMEECDVAEVLEGTIQSFDASLKKKNIEVFKNYQKETHHISKVDRNYLFQVFENIISNAIKFSEANKKLFLTVKKQDGYIIASIGDQGPGIKEEELDLLFKRYQKLTAIPTANEKSTGLGLSHAKKYVEEMNGRIWCESSVGKGSKFFISFKAIDRGASSVAAFL